jgi:hypothetical protein
VPVFDGTLDVANEKRIGLHGTSLREGSKGKSPAFDAAMQVASKVRAERRSA